MQRLPKLSHDDFEEALRLEKLYTALIESAAWKELLTTARLQVQAREHLILEADVEPGDAVKKQLLRGERYGIALLLATPVTIIEEARLRLSQYRDQENLSGTANPPKPDDHSEPQRPTGVLGGASESDAGEPLDADELAFLRSFHRAP